jgi:hypothetical protein
MKALIFFLAWLVVALPLAIVVGRSCASDRIVR